MSLLKWIGGHGSNFTTSSNWSPQQTPTSTSDCQVEPLSPVAISAGNVTINSLVTDANVTLSIVPTDTFTILGAHDAANPTGASANGGTISLGSACDFFLDGQFTNAGALNTAAGSDVWVNSTFDNDHTINQSGDFTLGQSHAGTVDNDKGAVWSIHGAVDIAAGPVSGSSFNNAGTLTRNGTGVTDIGVATTNSGQVSVTGGQLEFLSTVANTGAMTATGATLSLDSAVSGVGALDVGTRGIVDVVSGADSGQTVKFLGTGKLELDTAGTFAGHVSGFGGADLIDLASTIATTKSYSGSLTSGVLTVFDGSTAVAHLNFNGGYMSSSFSLGSDGHGGTLIHFL